MRDVPEARRLLPPPVGRGGPVGSAGSAGSAGSVGSAGPIGSAGSATPVAPPALRARSRRLGSSGGAPPLPPARRGLLPWELEHPLDAESPAEAGESIEATRAGASRGVEPPDADASPGAVPTGRSRLRVGVGAAVVLVIVALITAVLVSMFGGHGRLDVVSVPSGVPSTVDASAGGPGAGASVTAPPGAGSVPTSSAGPSSAAAGGASVGSATGTGTSAPILVHVLGAVVHPGLYELHVGDRVIDAVSAAGGFSPTADQGQQNLARVVVDGEQVVVPEQGALPPLGMGAAAGGAAGDSGVGSGSGGASAQPAAPVNLNTADETALETLPRVGPAMAQRIIAWRTENGRFQSVDDLLNVTGIGDKTFEALKPLVTI